MFFKKKVILASTIKDVEQNLEKLFQIFKNISALYKDYFIILVESDSSDDTYKKSKLLINSLNGKLYKLNTKNIKYRTQRIAKCRNKIIEGITSNPKLKKFDHLILLDADGVNWLINKNKIFNSIVNAPKDWSGLFPTQYFSYYDLWALRIKYYFDYDCYVVLKKLSKKKNSNEIYRKKIFNNFFLISKFDKRYISAKSAFGGLGIYKIKHILHSKYDSKKGLYSEHVLFNKKIIDKNYKLYIDKKLKNSLGLNEHFLKSFIYCFSPSKLKKLLIPKFK